MWSKRAILADDSALVSEENKRKVVRSFDQQEGRRLAKDAEDFDADFQAYKNHTEVDKDGIWPATPALSSAFIQGVSTYQRLKLDSGHDGSKPLLQSRELLLRIQAQGVAKVFGASTIKQGAAMGKGIVAAFNRLYPSAQSKGTPDDGSLTLKKSDGSTFLPPFKKPAGVKQKETA